jgi:hypothetical protein
MPKKNIKNKIIKKNKRANATMATRLLSYTRSRFNALYYPMETQPIIKNTLSKISI